MALIARRREGLEALAAELEPDARVLVLPADCTDEASIAAAIDQAAATFGGLDIVVSNAGIELLGQDDRVDRLELTVWRQLLQNNLDGQFLTCKHGIRHLLAAAAAPSSASAPIAATWVWRRTSQPTAQAKAASSP